MDTAKMFAAIPPFPADTKIATRKAGQDVLQPLAALTPLLIGGSADLYGSTLNYIGDLKKGDDDFKPGHRTGRNIRFALPPVQRSGGTRVVLGEHHWGDTVP